MLSSHIFLFILFRCFGYMETTSHGSRPGHSVTSGCLRSSILVITPCWDVWKVEPSGAWRSCRACTCTAASWQLSPMTSSTSCTACNFSTCRWKQIPYSYRNIHTDTYWEVMYCKHAGRHMLHKLPQLPLCRLRTRTHANALILDSLKKFN